MVREFARTGQVFQLSEGMSVRIRARVALWDRGGRYQLIVEEIDPDWSTGDQGQKLRRLVERLRREGILDSNGQLPMPGVPLRIGLITARDSAASQDFLQGLRASGYPFRVYAAWASMQGADTCRSVIGAFNRLLSIPDLDAVVLTRGGGSATDLAWFNDEHIAGVISQVPWPVISGIGHETDSTLPDYASHTSVRTPTKCAEFLVDRVADFQRDLDSLARVLCNAASSRLLEAGSRLSSTGRLLLRSGRAAFRLERQRLDNLADILSRGSGRCLRSASERLEGLGSLLTRDLVANKLSGSRRQLEMLLKAMASSLRHRMGLAGARLDSLQARVSGSDPEILYSRGWATVRNDRGELLKSISGTSLKEMLRITLRDGDIHARTEDIVPEGSEDE